MTTPEALEALARRCEDAGEGSREIDGEIFKAACNCPGDEWWRFDDGLWCRQDKEDRVAFDLPPSYTTSLDAAMTLVPAEAFWRLGHDGDGADPSEFRAQIIIPRLGGTDARGLAICSTPALSLTAAALRALAQHLPGDDRG